jgi:hypothetical protein
MVFLDVAGNAKGFEVAKVQASGAGGVPIPVMYLHAELTTAFTCGLPPQVHLPYPLPLVVIAPLLG